MSTPHSISIHYTAGSGELNCTPKSEHVLDQDTVTWETKDTDVRDWVVVFGPGEPVKPNFATSAAPTLTIEAKREPEDFRHVKYTVVALVNGSLKVKDPELIVDPKK